jgi:hypothetical protein
VSGVNGKEVVTENIDSAAAEMDAVQNAEGVHKT